MKSFIRNTEALDCTDYNFKDVPSLIYHEYLDSKLLSISVLDFLGVFLSYIYAVPLVDQEYALEWFGDPPLLLLVNTMLPIGGWPLKRLNTFILSNYLSTVLMSSFSFSILSLMVVLTSSTSRTFLLFLTIRLRMMVLFSPLYSIFFSTFTPAIIGTTITPRPSTSFVISP
ncbi:MAG: hypothetical protein ACTSPV_19500, partial [Candidatus Hodarchaeales archaeon]